MLKKKKRKKKKEKVSYLVVDISLVVSVVPSSIVGGSIEDFIQSILHLKVCMVIGSNFLVCDGTYRD